MSAAEETTEKLLADLEQAVRRAEAVIKESEAVPDPTAACARDQLLAALDSARAACNGIEQKAIEGAKAADKAIREHPYQALGIALGLGLVVGLLIKRR